MPTINQLVRKPRKSKVEKSKSPALNVGYNSHKNQTGPIHIVYAFQSFKH